MDYIYSNLVSHDISSVFLFILKGALSRLNCLSWIFYSKFTINKGGFIKIHLLYIGIHVKGINVFLFVPDLDIPTHL